MIVSALAAWLLTYALHSTILLTTIWAVTRFLRAPQWRDLLWKLGLTGGFVTASLQSCMQLQPLAGLPAWLNVPTPGNAVSGFLFPGGTSWLQGPTAAVVVGLWLTGAAVAVFPVWRRHRRLNRGLSIRTPVDDPGLVEMMADLSRRAGLKKPVRLSTLGWLGDPITISREETCIPTGTLRLERNQLRSVMAHEVAHAKRSDACLFRCGVFVERLFFFQPFLPVARREIRDAAEFLCDTWAADQVDQVTVARSILEVASWGVEETEVLADSAPIALPALMSGKTALKRRIVRLIEGPRAAELPLRHQWAAAILIWGAVFLAAPGVFR